MVIAQAGHRIERTMGQAGDGSMVWLLEGYPFRFFLIYVYETPDHPPAPHPPVHLYPTG